ncbi:CHASE domain-containing protein [Comamonas sp. JC664]|uniref:CHASE domain-containing protein n=1 Tax=Comamonas sp. JC664 TaxID=2801917 RepID=UPI00174807D8|nr:CHASE domain-containing protein [Comamonas sp. JC664]MBL0698909.1 CHASE domain-containing protein [Comamonas sp. JC664]
MARWTTPSQLPGATVPSHLLSHLRRNAASYSAVLVGLLVTAAAASYVWQSLQERRQRRFDDVAGDGTLSLQQGLDLYQALLLGVHGLFASSQHVDRNEFGAYVNSLELPRRYPGLQVIGFAEWLRPEDLARHTAEIRATGLPGYHVWPEGLRDAYSAIVFLEPFTPHNQPALGFDMLTEPRRRAAMLRALEMGLPSATGKVQLLQDWEDSLGREGFLLYVPVYHLPQTTTPPQSPQERLRGFVFAPIRMADLMANLRFPGFRQTIDLTVYDGTEVRDETLLYTSIIPGVPLAPEFKQKHSLSVAGQTWTLVFTARKAYLDRSTSAQVPIVVVSGLLVTMSLFLITRSQVKARAASEAAREEQQRLTGEARTAVQIRDDFLSIAAHELRTPLTSLKLQFQLLYRGLRGGNTPDLEKLQQRLESCERQTTRLTTLVDSLLDVSRLARGRLELNLEPLSLDEVTQEAARRFETEAQSAGVRLTVDTPRAVTGRWDRMRLEQVITNLLSNALKYGHGAPVDVRVDSDGTHATLEVKDHGIGMSTEDAQRIFGRFERAVSSRHYGGLGLGLFITRQLVEALGGHITVTSAPGQGSTFTVVLPLAGPRAG